jgi:tetratricopeptide (TPR) repeat protein
MDKLVKIDCSIKKSPFPRDNRNMGIQKTDTEAQKPKALKFLEGVVLIVCLSVLALRATHTESPHTITINPLQILGNDGFSLLLSITLIFSAFCWLIAALFQRQFTWRFSGIEIGLGILLIASAISYTAASNKRIAINEILIIAAPIVMAILLVQLLDTPEKIKLVFFITIALGLTTAYQCTDQLLSSNKQMIEDYESDPQKHLEMIGAETGSLKQFQYIHRLYSKDIRGFFTTSNSVGSFLILAAFTAAGLFIQTIKSRRSELPILILCFGLAALFTTAGLLITQSKGAILAAVFGGFLFAIYLAFKKLLVRYKGIIFCLCLIATAAVSVFIVRYGITHNRLPGGNSLLVRWQYWTGSAKMYWEHPFAGVGPANFSVYYPHYKLAAASETIRDPHNFILSVLTQFGPLGLLGFCIAFALPLLKTIFSCSHDSIQVLEPPKNTGLVTAVFVFVLLALFSLRPFLIAAELGNRFDVKVYVVCLLYIAPAFIFAAGFIILLYCDQKSQSAESVCFSAVKPALFCAFIAVLIHNLIDFALFEPGVSTLFWVLLACLVAINHLDKKSSSIFLTMPQVIRTICIIITLIVTGVILYGAIIPAVSASARIQQAARNPRSAAQFLEEASQADKLNPTPLNIAGRFAMQQYLTAQTKDPKLLQTALQYLLKAIELDPANFKHYEKLSDAYSLIAEQASSQEKSDALRSAYEYAEKARQRYPGSDRIHFKLAKLAEELNLPEDALQYYKKTVEIEDDYRKQFRVMYPDREIFSRLGPTNYKLANERIGQLEKELTIPSLP